MIVYLDILFAINFIMNYIVLVVSSSFGGIYVNRLRIILGSLAGTIYAVATFFQNLSFLNFVLIKIIMGVLITYITFGKKKIVKNTVLVMLVSSAMAGIITLISQMKQNTSYMMVAGVPYIDISLDLLISSFLIIYVGLGLMNKGLYKNKTEHIQNISVEIKGKTKKIATFCDTGNKLTDNITGMPIIVIEIEELESILPIDMKFLLNQDGVYTNLKNTRVRIINYKSLGKEDGIMTVVKPNKIMINNKEVKALIGISYDKIAINGANALMGV